MRKFLIAAAVSVSALAAASPAGAQYYPAPQQPYGNAYGYQNNQQNTVRNFVTRVDQIRYQIDRLDNRDRISEREARSLRNEAYYLRNRVVRSGYNGLSWRERQDLNVRLARLEQRVRNEVRDDNRRPGYRDGDRDGRYDRNDGWIDRDRDGRDDRLEDDRGRYPG
jgi:hypothetical protein